MQIGSLTLENNLFLAPMAGITDLPYRLIVKAFGAGLVFSEMVSANGLLHEGRKTRELLRSDPLERPLAVQLFGADADNLVRAADEIQGCGELVDINMGCPVKKVVRSGAGSALMREPKRVAEIVRRVRKVVIKPLTVKIRSGWDSHTENYLEIARIAQDEGADAVTLHPRTRAQNFGGRSDWEKIARLKEQLTIPVIGSGDIFSVEDADAMLARTGCDAVMVARGAYGNPWLVRDILARHLPEPLAPPSLPERLAVARRHLALHLDCFGPHRTLGEMRKHLCWYSRGISGAASYRLQINNAKSVEEMTRLTQTFFSQAAQPDGHA